MKDGRKKRYRILILCGAAFLAVTLALTLCFSMVGAINRKMNESAKSSLLSTTRVIEDNLEGFIEKDYDALNVVGAVYTVAGRPETEQLLAFHDTLELDWIGTTDAQGRGTDCFGNSFLMSEHPECVDWNLKEAGYSDSYIGRLSGRPQITLWVPVYKDGAYLGAVLGNVLLSQYYSASVFTFYEGNGRTYLFDGGDGAWILKSLGTDGSSTQQKDIYSLLAASGNDEKDVEAFRQAVGERKTGTGVFQFNGEESYLCFLPLPSSPDWYLTTVIAKDDLLRESAEVQQMIQWVVIILCVTLAGAAAAFVVWRTRRTKTAEARYREALFANLSANLDSAFLIYNKAGKTVEYVSDNSRRLLGLTQEWIKEDPGRLFGWCGISEADPLRTDFLEGALETAAVREVCVENELGEKARTLRLELIPADLGQELAVLTDITGDKVIQNSLKEAMERAEKASSAKNDFMSAMSHDLRTPINGIVGMTAIAAARLEEPDRVRDCLSKISESTTHLLNLINEVLDMSQIESGKMELSSEPFNLAELLQDILNMNYPGIQQKNHAVDVHIHSMEHEEVIGDPARLTRVAANLISNAIKYTPSGGTITLTLREKPSMLSGFGCYELIVRDNGIGMSPQFQKKLFDPFEREEDVRISRVQGTGLGMSIVKNIVALMMGSIEVESEKGKGSTFRVIVNLRLQEQKTEQNEQLIGLPVLVVDDDVVACETTTEILCDIGMAGEWTLNGADAVRKVMERHRKQEDYLAVLLDWKMPEMDGIETARRIRAEVGPHIPIIILTAYDWSAIEVEARAAGVDEFLQKPAYRAKLLQKMTEITDGHTKASDLFRPVSAGVIPTGKRVLLAEDNEMNTEIAVELLRMMGIQVDCAENGAVAVERFENSEPGAYDMILMDIQMPKMNGYEATKTIRGLPRPDARTIPIVAMTADAFKRDEQAAQEAGMDEHLSKPISVDRFREVLSRFLSSNPSEREESGHEPNL